MDIVVEQNVQCNCEENKQNLLRVSPAIHNGTTLGFNGLAFDMTLKVRSKVTLSHLRAVSCSRVVESRSGG